MPTADGRDRESDEDNRGGGRRKLLTLDDLPSDAFDEARLGRAGRDIPVNLSQDVERLVIASEGEQVEGFDEESRLFEFRRS